MKRSGFSRARVEPMRRRTRLRAKRRQPGVTGRPSLDRQAWELLKQALWLRAKGRCEVPWCRRIDGPLDPHHLQKRSAGGQDALDNLVLLCRQHHDQTDAAYRDGRLLVTMRAGVNRPRFQTLVATDKATARCASALGVEPSAGGDEMNRAVAPSRRRVARPETVPFVTPRSGQVWPTVPRGRR